jgi:hypothetical protein
MFRDIATPTLPAAIPRQHSTRTRREPMRSARKPLAGASNPNEKYEIVPTTEMANRPVPTLSRIGVRTAANVTIAIWTRPWAAPVPKIILFSSRVISLYLPFARQG